MNFKRFFISILLAAGALAVSCQEEKPVFGISVDQDVIEFPQGGGTAQVQVTTAQAWTVKIPSDASAWLTADPASGTGNATITFTASANEGKDRKTGLKINAGMAGYESVTASQPGALKPGDGLTPETAWSASEANAWIKANLADKQVTDQKYYIKGIIHKVQTTFAASGNYGNAVFFISDTGEAASDDFEAFQVYYLEGKQWKSGQPDVEVGDEVIIYGPVTLYGSTAETSGKGAAYIYSHLRNGETPTGGGTGGGDASEYNNAPSKTVKEFIEAADKNTYYKLSGTVGGSINTQYGNFDLTDATGTIYVFGTDNISDYASKLVKGASIVLAAKYDYYEKGSKHEAVHAYILSCEGGSQGGGGETGEIKAVTNAEFLAAEVSTTQWYELTGVVSNIVNTTYGNFDLTDAAGTKVYVYGLTATKVEKNDKTFASLNIKEGDTITIISLRSEHNGSPQAGGNTPAYIKGGGNSGGGEGGGDNPGGDSGQFSSNVSWTKGSNCYDDNTLNVNGVNGVANLKFGTSSKFGDATIVIPAGTKEVTFYAIAWNGKPASLKFSAGSNVWTFDVAANSGAANTAPYNVTVTDSDKYSVKLDSALASDTTVKVETYKGNNDGYRAFLFGVQAKK